METVRQLHVVISGRVQGVFFRAETRRTALALGITGWVRNLPDRTVEAVFEGGDEPLRQMMQWCHSGPPGARVDRVTVKTPAAASDFSGFEIRY
jgi:acylphosphatase